MTEAFALSMSLLTAVVIIPPWLTGTATAWLRQP